MKVYLVHRESGVFVFATAIKAVRDICYNDVEIFESSTWVRVTGYYSVTDIVDLIIAKNRYAIQFRFEDQIVTLTKSEVR